MLPGFHNLSASDLSGRKQHLAPPQGTQVAYRIMMKHESYYHDPFPLSFFGLLKARVSNDILCTNGVAVLAMDDMSAAPQRRSVGPTALLEMISCIFSSA